MSVPHDRQRIEDRIVAQHYRWKPKRVTARLNGNDTYKKADASHPESVSARRYSSQNHAPLTVANC